MSDNSETTTPLSLPLQGPSGKSAYVLVATLIVVLVVGLAAISLGQEKARYRERATIATQNLASLLDQHLDDAFDQIDIVLQSAAYIYEDKFAHIQARPKALNQFLERQELLVPFLDGLRIADTEGKVRYGRAVPEKPLVDISDREYFIKAKAAAQPETVVAGPLFSRISNTWVIVFARPLRAPDGSFAGVIYANLSTQFFEETLSSLHLGTHGAASIRTTDLALVHRFPDTKKAIGSRDVSAELREALQKNPKLGDYLAKTAIDGIERTNAYRRVHHYPFYVIVGLSTDDYLGGWRQIQGVIMGLGGLTIALTLFAAIILYRAHTKLAADLAERTRIGHELQAAMEERLLLNRELEIRTLQAESANRAKTTFLGNMSHEMRTPLHQINGLTSLIAREPLSAKQSEFLEKLQQVSKHLSEVIEGILDFTRIEASDFTLAHTPIDLQGLLERLCRPYATQAMARGLAFNFSSNISSTIALGDEKTLGVALGNYLQNALRFTNEGKIDVRLTETWRDTACTTLRFEVEDTGIGIDASVLPRLFHLFEQADNSPSRAYGGTGMGLAVTRRIASMMTGDAGCTSERGKGSCFWFTVTLDLAPAALPLL